MLAKNELLHILNKNKFYLLLIPVIYGLFQVAEYGVNVVFWDEWGVIRLYEDLCTNGLTLTKLFAQHNEHRIFFPRIVMLISGIVSHWNVKVNMYITQAMMIVIYAIYMNQCTNIEKARNTDQKTTSSWTTLFFRLFIGLSCFSAVQWENFLWGFQVGFMMVAMTAVLSFYFYHRAIQKNTTINLILSLTFGAIASFSSLQGLGVWIVYAGMFSLTFLSREKINHKKQILTLLIGIICIVFYLKDYTSVSGHPDIFKNTVWHLFRYFCTAVGSIASPLHYKPAMILGTVIIAFSFLLTTYLIKTHRVKENFFAISILYYGFAVLGMISLGRAGFGIEQALSSRYTTFAMLPLIGLSLIIYRESAYENIFNLQMNLLKAMRPAMFLLMILTASIGVLTLKRCQQESDFKQKIAGVLQYYPEHPLTELKQLYPWSTYQEAYNAIEILERKNFNVFYADKLSYGQTKVGILRGLKTVSLKPNIDFGFDINTIKWDEKFIYFNSPWAADFYTGKEYLNIYVRLNEKLYNTISHLDRPDVAAAFNNPNFLRSGFSFAFRRDELKTGENRLSIIITLNDGSSYYESDTYSIYKSEETGTITNFPSLSLLKEKCDKVKLVNIVSSVDIRLLTTQAKISLVTTGSTDPQIVFESLKQPVKPVNLEIRFSDMPVAGVMQLFYADAGEGFSEEHSIPFQVSPERKVYDLTGFKSPSINSLRLDFVNIEGVTYNIESIKLYYQKSIK